VSLQAALPGSDLQYQKLSYDGAVYTPINDKVTFAVKGRVGVGQGSSKTGGVPFFDKYYAGGINSVRGFDQSTLGKRDNKNDPMGGDLLTTATAEVQFPAPFAEDVKGLKMSTFIDAGNVFPEKGDFNAKDIRYSAGVGAVWLSPIGPFELSYAKPLNSKQGDDEQAVQFSIGANF
jgi:outer membrane protein insertion porin family